MWQEQEDSYIEKKISDFLSHLKCVDVESHILFGAYKINFLKVLYYIFISDFKWKYQKRPFLEQPPI